MREKGRTAELINKPTAAFLKKLKSSKIDRVACVIKKTRDERAETQMKIRNERGYETINTGDI